MLLLARSPDDLMAGGGIRQAWTLTGRNHFEIQEIDYAEVLRERGGGDDVTWDRIIAYCLEGKKGMLDAGALASLLEALADPARVFDSWSSSCRKRPVRTATKVGVRVAALLQLMRTAIDAARTQGEAEVNRAFETIADLLRQAEPRHDDRDARSPAGDESRRSRSRVECGQSDDGPGDCLVHGARGGRQIVGGTERLAQALEALAPDARPQEGAS